MKKNIHLSFPHVFGLHAVHRLVFENPGETEAFALAGVESGKEKELDANKEGQKGLDKTLKAGNDLIDAKAEEYKKKYEGKDDYDKAKTAIEAAQKKAKEDLKAKYEAAGSALKQNAVTASNESANVLLAERKAKSKAKYGDKSLDNYKIGNSSLDWKPEGKKFTNEDMTDGDFREVMVSMLRAVYVAEGEEAANKLMEKMKKGKEVMDFDKLKYDPDFNFAQGVEHDPPLIQFDPDVEDGNYNSHKLAGLIFGYNHAANNVFKENEGDAREAYKGYLAASGKKCADKTMSMDDIQSPDEWVKSNPQYMEKTKEVDEEKLDKERLARVNEAVGIIPDSFTWQREQLKGILLGRLKGEKDPKNWDAIIADTSAKCMGVDLSKPLGIADFAKMDPNGIDKMVGSKSDAMGQYATDKGKNHDGKTRGYIAGLMLAAEDKIKDPVLLKKYQEELRNMTDSDDFKAKLGQSLEDSDYYSKRQRDFEWGKSKDQDEQNRKEGRKLGEANDAIFDVAKKTLRTPDAFMEDYKEKQEKKDPRDKYVDDMLEKANFGADKSKEKSYLRGMLMASLGAEKDPAKMEALMKPVLDQMGLKPDALASVTEGDHLKKILEGRSDFGENGKKIDFVSKGYLATLMFQAEQKYKDNPKLLDAYKKHLTDSVNSEGYKTATQEKMEKIKKYQDYLEDPVLSKRLTEEDKRTYREGIATLSDQIFMETRKATEWPEDFEKKKAPELKAEDLKVRTDFLDKYGQADKLDVKGAKASLDGIFGSVPKDKITDANKKGFEDKQKELAANLAKAKTPEDRLKILAQAQDFTAHFVDDKAPEKRFQDVAENYTVTAKILETSKDKKKSDTYIKAMAKALGYKDDDQATKDAVAKVAAASDADRAGVLADQIALLAASAPAANKPATLFTKSDYDDYAKYIADKKAADDAKKKSNPPQVGGGGQGGAPTPGGPGGAGPKSTPGGGPKPGPGGAGPKPGPGGGKETPGKGPETKKETIDVAAMTEKLKTAIAAVLAKYKGQTMPESKTAADLAKEIQGALAAAVISVCGPYDMAKLTGSSMDIGEGLKVTVVKADQVDTNVGLVITEEWVNKNLKPKELIHDELEATRRMNNVLFGVVKKYEQMDFAGYQKAGITDSNKLNQTIIAEIMAGFPGQNIDPNFTFSSDKYQGYVFKAAGGKQWVDAQGVQGWDQRTFEAKKRDAELGTDKPKLDAITSYMTRQGYSYLEQNVGNGTFKTLAAFTNGVNTLFSTATSKYELKDGSYNIWVQGSGFTIKYQGGKYAGVSGDYAGLAASVTGGLDKPKLA